MILHMVQRVATLRARGLDLSFIARRMKKPPLTYDAAIARVSTRSLLT